MTLTINIKNGEDYGFPRMLPVRLHNVYQNSLDLKNWFLDNGYPTDLFEKNKWTITVKKS